MAKAEKKTYDRLLIFDREEANAALKKIGELKVRINTILNREQKIILDASERITEETEADRQCLKVVEKELERWATGNRATWGESRSLQLTAGLLSFRLTPPAIVYTLKKVKHVIERLRAKKMAACIRMKEEVDKEALAAYPDDVLREVGCKRVQKDEFHYDVLMPEVK